METNIIHSRKKSEVQRRSFFFYKDISGRKITKNKIQFHLVNTNPVKPAIGLLGP